MSNNVDVDLFKQALNDASMEIQEGGELTPSQLEPIEKVPQIKDKRTPIKKADPVMDEPIMKSNEDDDEDEVVVETPSVDEPNEISEISEIRTIAQHYAEKGVLANVDPEEIKDLEDEEAFEYMINTTVESRLAEYKERIPEDARYLLEYLEEGGDPRTYMEMMQRPDYSKVKITGDENLAMQKKVIRDFLAYQDYSSEQIERRIERYLEKDLLEDEAEIALEQLQKAQSKEREFLLRQQKEAQEQAQKQYDDYLVELKGKVTSKKDIAGFELKPDQARKLYDHMTKPVTKDGKTQFMLNYEKDPDAMLKVAYFDMMGWDFSKVTKQVETKVTKSLKDKLKTKDTMHGMKGSTGNSEGDNLSAFRSLLNSKNP